MNVESFGYTHRPKHPGKNKKEDEKLAEDIKNKRKFYYMQERPKGKNIDDSEDKLNIIQRKENVPRRRIEESQEEVEEPKEIENIEIAENKEFNEKVKMEILLNNQQLYSYHHQEDALQKKKETLFTEYDFYYPDPAIWNQVYWNKIDKIDFECMDKIINDKVERNSENQNDRMQNQQITDSTILIEGPIKWTSYGGEIRLNNENTYHLKGINWFGLETGAYYLFGLEVHSLEWYLDFLIDNNFNVIRIPFSLDVCLNLESLQVTSPSIDNTMTNINVGTFLDRLFVAAGERGILIVPDLHVLDIGLNSGTWFNSRHPFDEFTQCWDNMLSRYSKYWNLLGVDLFNEPYGPATWQERDLELNPPIQAQSETDNIIPESTKTTIAWNIVVEDVITYLLNKHDSYFNGLFFIEGISATSQDSFFSPNWGENLSLMQHIPLLLYNNDNVNLMNDITPEVELSIENLTSSTIEIILRDQNLYLNNRYRNLNYTRMNRLVFSPHTYGPSVFNKAMFNDFNVFPNSLFVIWNYFFGFTEAILSRSAIMLGEWGGRYNTGPDISWQNSLANYLLQNCFSDNFYWCLNPNSGDTGGILYDDWTTPVTEKLNMLHSVQPSPSFLTLEDDTADETIFLFKTGAYANNKCSRLNSKD